MQSSRLSNRGLSIGQVATRTGLAPSAIRYYETEGLVAPDRTDTGQRRYARSDIRRLSFVMISQGLGFTIAEIREALGGLPGDRTPDKRDWARISARFGAVLDARIAQMQALREKLDGCIGCGCLSLRTCALYNPRDDARRHGAGPRYLMGDRSDSD
ncbi:redox-sensitive transcriptional activator SoxR [Pseudohalocynthiibacter aestuariivivens]|uniref:Redox-sensitive transcriptional activator SoxR n=1 Tax=Roseovarius pelagicus TaxID=2980108 RepID=A0ABY6D7I7_9RHOB|nr:MULTISPECIES: redox-sensitive transcriptional activator SoxR [Rhodobacterales]QIE45942.1 redox-sensitive transcriptional activator SoxR [Pseudohalocynthiibacter aestuariivivens]UXX82102.1 redox-sensitive transcriptional activator SoxR [Roseovarius pelagicus]